MILNRLIYSLLLCAMLTVACPVRGEDTVSVARGPYPFLNLEANRIELNGDNWRDLSQSLLACDSHVGVVQIGDSHIQPGIVTRVLRVALQNAYGNGGRGLLAALNIVRTNEPRDYILKLNCGVQAKSRVGGARPWAVMPGVTGVAAVPDSAVTVISVRAKNARRDKFTAVTLLHEEGGGYGSALINDRMVFGRTPTPRATTYPLGGYTDSVSLSVPTKGAFYGAILHSDSCGVVVSSIGNNGATYGSYLAVRDFAKQLQILEPQLIIISLGTNEAFGNLSGVMANIRSLVKLIRSANPRAKILLTTPMECHHKVTRKVGRRSRRHGQRTVTSYAVNEKIQTVRNMILSFGREQHIATWDLYEVAGGAGAANKWIAARLMNGGDHLHCLDAGYELQGELLTQAVMRALERRH